MNKKVYFSEVFLIIYIKDHVFDHFIIQLGTQSYLGDSIFLSYE